MLDRFINRIVTAIDAVYESFTHRLGEGLGLLAFLGLIALVIVGSAGLVVAFFWQDVVVYQNACTERGGQMLTLYGGETVCVKLLNVSAP